MASIEVVFGGVEGRWRGIVVSRVVSWISQEGDRSGHDRAMKETTLNICPIHGSSSGSQYLRTMVKATAEHLQLTHATTIEAPKSFQKFPP
jgi:hypothetical protein